MEGAKAQEVAKMEPVRELVVERMALRNGKSDPPLPPYSYSDCERY